MSQHPYSGGTDIPNRSGAVPQGTVVASEAVPGAHGVILEDIPHPEERRLIDTHASRDWEFITVARPVDTVENVYEVPTTRTVQTMVPKVQVREVVKTIERDEPQFIDEPVEIQHSKIVDRYVEVPVVTGTEIKYVPKVEVRERTIKTTRPEIKWVEKVVEVPQIKEVVRYVESGSQVEQVIRYVPKGFAEERSVYTREVPHEETVTYTERSQVEPTSPRVDRMEQLFIPRVAKTVEVEKEIPVTVNVPVPFMVPKPIQVPVDVPVIKFRDHFVPVPVRRHVIPKITFTEQHFEVECVKEKPVLVVEDYLKPVPVDVRIKLRERDIRVLPMDPAQLSQADFQAMWMRVNADLLERARATGNVEELHEFERRRKLILELQSLEEQLATKGEDAENAVELKEEIARLRIEIYGEKAVEGLAEDLEPLPLHPGHPLMMTYLQNQWIQNPSTLTHNMYTPEFFRMHASALDSLLHPQLHQVNVTQEQCVRLGPLPSQQLPSPWTELNLGAAGERSTKRSSRSRRSTLEPETEGGVEGAFDGGSDDRGVSRAKELAEAIASAGYFPPDETAIDDPEAHIVRRAACSPCSVICCGGPGAPCFSPCCVRCCGGEVYNEREHVAPIRQH